MNYPYPSLRQGLVGAWCPSLGDSGATLRDRSGRYRNGSLNSSSYLASGSGVSVSAGGSSAPGFFTASPVAAFGASATLSVWLKLRLASPTDSLSTGVFFADGTTTAQSASHYPWTDGNLYFRAFRSARVTITPLASVDRSQWHCLTITTDGVNWILYQAGRVATSVAAESTVAFNSSLFSIGRSYDGATYYYLDGQFDDVRLYNRALTLAEVRLLASRRGIGLTPIGSTRATYPTKFQIRVGGTWREADAYQNVGGVWQKVPPSIKVAGVWK